MLRRTLAAALAMAPAALAIASCRSPTQIRVELSTDLDCARVGETEIRTATSPTELASLAPGTVADGCQAPGDVGSIVLRPSGARDGRVVLSAVLRPRGGACSQADRSRCPIEARRILSYIPSTPLRLPIQLRTSCQGVTCPNPEETCVQGTCRPAFVEASLCARPEGCDEAAVGTAPDGGATADGGSDGAALLDAGGDGNVADGGCAPPKPYTTAPFRHWPFDEATGNITQDTQALAMATVPGQWRMGVCGAAHATDAQFTLANAMPLAELHVAAWVLVPASVAAPFPLLSTLDGNQSGWELRLEPGMQLRFDSCVNAMECDSASAPVTPGWRAVYAFRGALGIGLGVDGGKPMPLATLHGTPQGAGLRVGSTPNAIIDELYFFAAPP